MVRRNSLIRVLLATTADRIPMVTLLISLALIVIGRGNALAQIHEVVVSTGQNVAGGNGQYGSFANPVFTDSGYLAFESTLIGTSGGTLDNLGLFRARSLALSPTISIARKGSTVPGGDGQFLSFDHLNINEAGEVAYLATLSGTSGGLANNRAGYVRSGSTTSEVARAGAEPFFGEYYLDFGSLHLNNSGQVMVHSILGASPGGIATGSGLIRVRDDLIAYTHSGVAAPDGNGQLASFASTDFNSTGQISFLGGLNGTALGTNDDTGIFRANDLSIVQIVREGQVAADGNGNYASFHGPDLNHGGQVAFHSYLQNTLHGGLDNQGIFRGSGGTLTQIARTGHVAADGNGYLHNIRDDVFALNDLGQVAFMASLRGTAGGTADNEGLFRGDGSPHVQIARENQSVVDGNGKYGQFLDLTLNNSGVVGFSAALKETAGGSNDNLALYLSDGIDTLQITRKGNAMSGSVVSSFSFDRDGLNEFGQMAYRVSLANGNQQINIYTPLLHWRENTSGTFQDAQKWTLGLRPGTPHIAMISPEASLTVLGPDSDTTLRGLVLGGGPGLATLQLTGGHTLTTTNGMTIQSTGRLSGDGTIAGDLTNFGRIETANDWSSALHFQGNVVNNGTMGGGRITFAAALTNNGTISGSGKLESTEFMDSFVNSNSGQIRVAAGESRGISALTINYGRVEAIGGEVIFEGSLVNEMMSGLVTGRGATYRFENGMLNRGGMGFSFGTSDVIGDIHNEYSGVINLSGGANVTFYDDVIQWGELQIAAVGSSHGTAVIFGDFSGPGGFTGGGDLYALGDLRPGASPASVLMDGNLFLGSTTDLFIELAGTTLGTFDQLRVSGSLNLAGELFVSTLDGFQLALGDQFLIADVIGVRSGLFTGLNEGDFVTSLNGVRLYITYQGGDGNDVLLFTAIPEPNAVAWIAAGLFGLLLRHRRRKAV